MEIYSQNVGYVNRLVSLMTHNYEDINEHDGNVNYPCFHPITYVWTNELCIASVNAL